MWGAGRGNQVRERPGLRLYMLAATPVRRAAASSLLSRVQSLDPGVRKTAAKRCASRIEWGS
jgi:hypothetical protein